MRIRIASSVLLASLSFLYSSCITDPVRTDDIPPIAAENLAYGSDPKQVFDIYLPSNHGPNTKMMIMIHGGAWSLQDKADFRPFVDTMKRRLPEYGIVNINYRLASGSNNLFPTQEMDVKAAIEYLYSKKDFYGFSDKFVLLGASAGAHLALLHAYKYQSPVKIKAVVDFFGPTDMTDLYNNPASVYAPPSSIAAVLGATPSSNPTIYTQSSPVTFVSAATAMPTIIFQGGMDPLVRAVQSATLHNLLNAAGIVNQYTLYPNGGHGDWDQVTFTDAFNKTQAFLLANVQ